MLDKPHRRETGRNSAVYEDLRALVVGGEIEPGSRIRVDGLAERLESGKTPLREALFQLSSENLVLFRYQQGFWMPRLDAADLAGLIATKTAMERLLLADPEAVRASQWQRDLVIAFHDLAAAPAFDPAATFADNRIWLAAHRAFHAALVAGSPNGWAARQADMLDANIDRYRSHVARRGLPLAAEGLNSTDAHRALFDLARAGDFVGLTEALTAHNMQAASTFAAALEG